MNKWKIALIPGETVGPELIREADRLLDTVGRVYHIPMERIHLCAGGAAIDRWNDPLPAAVRARAASCDAILFGSIGAAKYNALPPEKTLRVPYWNCALCSGSHKSAAGKASSRTD